MNDLLKDELEQTERSVKSLRKTGRYFIAIAILLGLGLLYNGWRTLEVSADTKTALQSSSIEACERGNESRVARVLNLYRDIEATRADIHLVENFEKQLPVDALSIEVWKEAKLQAITYKRAAIRAELRSVKPYAVRPGSAIVNCSEQFPNL